MLDVTNTFTVEDMYRFAGEAWGQFCVCVVDQWCKFNADYFDNALKPVPLVLTQTQPFGKRLAFCSHNAIAGSRTITLNVPKQHKQLLADKNTLLHEMVHQFLFERGENAAHSSEAWRREIMRLTKTITGNDIWAGRSMTIRQNKRIVRINAPHPQTKEPSLPQGAIARWPHDGLGINFGHLGV